MKNRVLCGFSYRNYIDYSILQKILPTGYADFLSPSALEVISSYDDDQLDEFANLSKAELLKLIKMLARHIVAKRSLDYLYGGVRYRKRSPM
ncbi:unnamed protein product [Hymenolepis diminuta]|uniref:Myosin motor domain-containing protein n=1 Tax=Hymenolepis diminuta TaxID=6216 RepID=A0A0R3SP98_HYMDI|nr:unnamed protein product [Hymenolepis diminuta]